MRQIISILLIVLLSSVMAGRGSKARTKASVKKEKTELSDKISKTKKKIQANKAKTARLLSDLNTIQAQIQSTDATIKVIRYAIDSLTRCEKIAQDSIANTQAQISTMETECAKQLRNSRKQRKSMSALSMLASAQSVSVAIKRSAYIRQLNQSIVRKSEQLQTRRLSLEEKRNNLASMKKRQLSLADSLAAERARFTAQQAHAASIVEDLKQEGDALSAVLEDQRAMSQRLDNELNAIIAEEKRLAEQERLAEERRRKAAEKKAAENKAKVNKTASTNETAQSAKRAPSADAPTTRPKRQNTGADKASGGKPSQSAKHSTNFAANKGNMIFPVPGNYTIVRTFGVNRHENLPYVQTDNPGIDIKAGGLPTARCVFDGTVSSISMIGGYHNVVMVRHGEYITIYAGIDKLNVKKGDKVAAGDAIGQIFTGDNGAVLHFEVRKETQKLNPLEWVKR